jgi:hypothetical protein
MLSLQDKIVYSITPILEEQRLLIVKFDVNAQYGHSINSFITLRPKKKICVFTVTRPTLIFASDPMHFYTEFG